MLKIRFSGVIVFLTILMICPSVFSVNTAKIDIVRSRETLTDSDTTVIEEFLDEALDEFVTKKDFSDIASLRNTIISKSTSELESGQFQYGPRFLTAAQKYIPPALEKVSKMPNSERKQLLTMNLLILISNLGNVEISKSALDYLQSPDVAVRYWAVNCLTNSKILGQLNTAGSVENTRLAGEFAQKLLDAAKTEQSGDILILIAQFASNLKQPAGDDILNEIVQKRTNLYLNWQVKDEFIENRILKALSERPQADSTSTAAAAKNFAILYSLVIQRYILGQESLPATNVRNLVSVIVQGEKYLTKFLPDWQGNLKRAIEKGGGSMLLAEHDSLLGSATAAGRLPAAAGFDYGKNPDGSVKTAPPTLPKPPQTESKPVEKPEKTVIEPNQ